MLQAERDYARVQNNHFLKLSIVCIVPVLTIIGPCTDWRLHCIDN